MLNGNTMGVSTKHPLWKEKIWDWTLIRDCLEGESRIKFRSETYLPIPAGMLELPDAPSYQRTRQHSLAQPEYFDSLSSSYNPNEHPISAYASYKSRAAFPNLVSFLYRGLLGLSSAEQPSIRLPPEMEYLESEYATPEGLTLSRLFAKTLGEVLLTGRYSHVLDPRETDDGDRILIIDYRAEQFINWKSFDSVPALAVFNERENKVKESDVYTHEMIDTYKVQSILGQIYEVLFYDKDEQNPALVTTPAYKGTTLTSIPLTVIGSMNNTLKPDPAPLTPVANNSIQIYMKNADLAQAEFLTANPTLIITGSSDQDSVVATGPTVALRFSNPQAKVYYTETDTSALKFMLDHVDTLYEQSVLYGAQLLRDKTQNETAETARLRQTSASATLRSVVVTVGQAMERELKNLAKWMGLSQTKIDGIQFRPLTDFGMSLTPQEQNTLVESWLAGAISHQTVLTNFKKAGILGEGRTEEDELNQLNTEFDSEDRKNGDESSDGSEMDSSSDDESSEDGDAESDPKIED